MGTDIHMIAERRDPDTGTWHLVTGPTIPCWSCDGKGIVTVESHGHYRAEWLKENLGKPCRTCTEDGSDCDDPIDRAYYASKYVGPGLLRDEWYGDRNYNVFAYLGDVRNGSGFAGIDTGDRVEPLPQRGDFPLDLSDEGQAWFEAHGGDHSPNWLSLQDIFDRDWDEPMTHRGVVNAAEFVKWETEGQPDRWSGMVSGGSVRHVDHAKMRELITTGFIDLKSADGPFREPTATDGNSYYTHVEWKTTARESLGKFLDRMNELRALFPDADPSDIRIVFNFDS